MRGLVLTCGALLLAGCGRPAPTVDRVPAPPPAKEESAGSFKLTSPAFAPGAALPARHALKAGNVSPPLAWTDPPAGTRAFALLVVDPDAPAGDWVHWVLLNLPATARSLPAGVSQEAKLPDGSLNGQNDFGHLGWDGPSPPSGTHRYHFQLLALAEPLALGSGATRADVRRASAGHVVGEAELVGTYAK